MKPKLVELYQSVRHKRELPPLTCPEIALVGRSNVGKSSLINTMVQRRNLARTSNTPGKTRAVHFYRIDERFFFVDLPGYGYARVSREQQRAWKDLVDAYLEKRKGHALLLQVVDLRHPPSEADRQMAAWIRHYSLPYRVVATKADKVPRGNRIKHIRLIATGLETDTAEVFLFSSSSGEGKDVLWGEILDEMAKHSGSSDGRTTTAE
ncbi:MAG: ribosome biogenesis GTP-binding protein YihA/YsxC [Bacillota bacterium]